MLRLLLFDKASVRLLSPSKSETPTTAPTGNTTNSFGNDPQINVGITALEAVVYPGRAVAVIIDGASSEWGWATASEWAPPSAPLIDNRHTCKGIQKKNRRIPEAPSNAPSISLRTGRSQDRGRDRSAMDRGPTEGGADVAYSYAASGERTLGFSQRKTTRNMKSGSLSSMDND